MKDPTNGSFNLCFQGVRTRRLLRGALTLLLALSTQGIASAASQLPTIEIDSCHVLNESDTIYKLTTNLEGYAVTANCMEITAENIVLDCQGHSLRNTNLASNVIYSNADHVIIENCEVSARLACQTCKPGVGIKVSADHNIVKNNRVKSTFWGIVVNGYHNIVEGNWVEGNGKGIHFSGNGNSNIVKNNLIKNNNQYQGWGIGVWRGKGGNTYINNKVYGSRYGVVLYDADDTVFKCDQYSNTTDIYLYSTNQYSGITNSNHNVTAYGVTYSKKYIGSGAEFTEFPDDCAQVDCIWEGDNCIAPHSCNCNDPHAITGSSGSDILFATEEADIICGRGGDDFIAGQGGDDCIDGGDGKDWIYGGQGNDRIFGGDGKDVIYGHDGNDEINGDEDDDYLFGGVDDDKIDGGEGYDWVFCGSGKDVGVGEYTIKCEN
jgi:parallel beta-helix repeat protein